MNKNKKAPKGQLWVCLCCGKTSSDLYGDAEDTSKGWDASCILNAQLFNENDIVYDKGRVVEIKS
jgi:hypothetical protein